MKGEKVIADQTDDDQRKPEGIALEKRYEGITEKTDEHEEVEKCKYVVEHYNPEIFIKIPIPSLINNNTILSRLCSSIYHIWFDGLALDRFGL